MNQFLDYFHPQISEENFCVRFPVHLNRVLTLPRESWRPLVSY